MGEAFELLKTTCCVVGGGPAGMMAGYLLARAGVEVIVIEKPADFLRDFRGDTVHPSTLELMYELGILDRFLKRPHQEVQKIGGQIGDDFIQLADFSHLNTKCKFIALMPQWEFLNFLAERASKYSTFNLRARHEAVELIKSGDSVMGVIANAPDGEVRIEADLVLAADGRGSIIRQKAGFEVQDLGAPMDVLWMRISRKQTDLPEVLGRIKPGAIFIMINRNDYWQCGYVIAKGKNEELRARSIEHFRERVAYMAPILADRVHELESWDDVKLLTVKVDRLPKWWREGLLCIGDSAHAMSPIGGVGINLAIQDAVAAVNLLWRPLLERSVRTSDLERVQKRRMFPTRATQRIQVEIQNRVIQKTLAAEGEHLRAPWLLEQFNKHPLLQRIPARAIGVGIRPEHIHSPQMVPPVSN